MMLKCFLLFLLLLGGLWGCARTVADYDLARREESPTVHASPEKTPHRLSDFERAELKRLVPQILEWSDFWEMQYQCPSETAEAPRSPKTWQDQFRAKIGREIEIFVKLESVYQFAVLIPDLSNTLIRFNRIDGKILEPLRPELLCSETESFRQDSERLVITVTSRHSRSGLDIGQKALVDKLTEYSNQIACDRRIDNTSSSVRVYIPYSKIGDPAIFLLIEQKASAFSSGDSLDSLELVFDSESQTFVPRFSKTIKLSVEVDRWARIVRQHTVKNFVVRCS